ncbi:MAG: alpha-glucosidase/alpha-galactosidase [Oscillospiraceae bacterium]|nr:alpha-glucosidase/alpha-galactosidase [Oscillospiraceae bacterium]
MGKITFMGAGSNVFAKNVLGDSLLTEALRDFDIALYDIDPHRLDDSYQMIININANMNDGRANVKKYVGVENRKEALRGADFVVNAIQVGRYEPCTVTDFEVPKKHGLRQTIGDTLGIGGIFRGLRTIPVLESFADDMSQVCPNAWFMNYTNPMAILSGFMQRYTGIKTVGLCHSVQSCSHTLLNELGIQYTEPVSDVIAGINHMAWLMEIKDGTGKDLYPEIRKRAFEELEKPDNTFRDLVRFEYIRRLGYYCTESSEHNAEYNPFFIKTRYPELIKRYNIPLDEYPRRCIEAIQGWENKRKQLIDHTLTHTRTHEYASYIMEAMVTNKPIFIGGNVINTGLIDNLPREACVEVTCMINRNGVNPCHFGSLPTQLAAMNMSNIGCQLLTIEAAVTRKKEKIYQAAMMEPHTASELSIDDIVSLCDDLIKAHGDWLPKYN